MKLADIIQMQKDRSNGVVLSQISIDKLIGHALMREIEANQEGRMNMIKTLDERIDDAASTTVTVAEQLEMSRAEVAELKQALADKDLQVMEQTELAQKAIRDASDLYDRQRQDGNEIARLTEIAQAANRQAEEWTTAWHDLRGDVLRGVDGLDSVQVNEVLGMLDNYEPSPSMPLAAPQQHAQAASTEKCSLRLCCRDDQHTADCTTYDPLRKPEHAQEALSDDLPPLPEAIEVGGEGWCWEDFQSEKTFSVEHMENYARAAILATSQPAPVAFSHSAQERLYIGQRLRELSVMAGNEAHGDDDFYYRHAFNILNGVCREFEKRTATVASAPAVAVQDMLKAAIAWWEECRPVDWSEASHIEHPTVNTLTESGNALGKAVATYLASPQPAAAPVAMTPMGVEGDQWYFDCDGHYIDVKRDEDGKYSIYFRNRKDGSEAWHDQADIAPVAAAVQEDILCMTCDGHGAREDDPGEWSECPICKGTGIAVGQPPADAAPVDAKPVDPAHHAYVRWALSAAPDGWHAQGWTAYGENAFKAGYLVAQRAASQPDSSHSYNQWVYKPLQQDIEGAANCPFCGGENVSHGCIEYDDSTGQGIMRASKCNECQAIGPLVEYESEADLRKVAQAWDQRPISQDSERDAALEDLPRFFLNGIEEEMQEADDGEYVLFDDVIAVLAKQQGEKD